MPIPDVLDFAWVQYGLVAGMPRLIKLLSDRGLKASAFMNAACADVCGSCAERMLRAGWEFVGHGYVQRSLQKEENEDEVIERSLERLRRLTGKRPRGLAQVRASTRRSTPRTFSRNTVSISLPTVSWTTCPAG